MDYYQGVVAEWLVADGRTLVAEEFLLPLQRKSRWIDILAVRLWEPVVYLCEVTWGKKWKDIVEKIEAYHACRSDILSNVVDRVGVSKSSRIEVWYFVPDANIELLERRLLPHHRVKVTPLEAIKPWDYTYGTRPHNDHARLLTGKESACELLAS